ncbi:response regulator transcription factor [Ruminococcaceae bacterium OttesenSCG-928-L11]|nr:response regulator transcription factor [Ruminococcaceae bacterium OttesenSCG-928-L11]
MPNAAILLVEDNPRIQLANKDILELMGYEVAIVMSLAEARAHMAVKMPDAIVLDIMLPDGNGLDFLAELRRTSDLPVLLLTALASTDDTVNGLARGADDYLAKPYDYKVLAARVEALLRRANTMPQMLHKGVLTFNVLSGQAFLRGEDMLLTQKEFSCLLLLAQNENRSLSAEYLYETVWRQPIVGDTQAVRSAVMRLRGKLDGSGYAIVRQRGMGYVFQREI